VIETCGRSFALFNNQVGHERKKRSASLSKGVPSFCLDLQSIDWSHMGHLLSSFVRDAATTVHSPTDAKYSMDHLPLLSYATQACRVLRTAIAHQCSCQPMNPGTFLQCQHLIDILHSAEFILDYLHRYHARDRTLLVNTLSDLSDNLAAMRNNLHRLQSMCQALFRMLHDFNERHISFVD
jgi:hypothetical protein